MKVLKVSDKNTDNTQTGHSIINKPSVKRQPRPKAYDAFLL